jgi:hypothetical protein
MLAIIHEQFVILYQFRIHWAKSLTLGGHTIDLVPHSLGVGLPAAARILTDSLISGQFHVH